MFNRGRTALAFVSLNLLGLVMTVCAQVGGGTDSTATALPVGLYVGIATTPATDAWKLGFPADSKIIFTLNTSTGSIVGCGNATSRCSNYGDSNPAVTVGTYVGLGHSGYTKATDAWRKTGGLYADEQLLYVLNSADGTVFAVGNATGRSARVGGPFAPGSTKIGRFTAAEPPFEDVPDAWHKTKYLEADEQLVVVIDSTNNTKWRCGNATGRCTH